MEEGRGFTEKEMNIKKDSILGNFIQRWRNAKAVARQIRNNEWKFYYNNIEKICCTARRNDHELWVANGGFFCDVDNKNAFGFLFRHYVWWAAARKARKQEDRQNKQSSIPDLTK